MTGNPVPGEAIAAASTLLEDESVPGAAIALKVDDAAVVTVGVGTRDLDGRVPMPADARFPLYSITKTILAVAALRLVDAGRLALDADVRDRLPGVELPAQITLRQLLSHTGGLPDYGAMPAYAAALREHPTRPWTDDTFLTRTLAGGMLFRPGEGWAYSNLGYLLVRRLVERAGGDGSLRTALRRLVFEPAGVPGMGVASSLEDMAQVTAGYSAQLDDDGEPRDVRSRYHPGWVAHGLVTATAADTARFIAAVFEGHLLRPATLRQMLEAVRVEGTHPPFREAGYGLGLMVDLDPDIGLVAGHAGGGPGYATAAFRFEGTDGRRVTSVVLANRDAGDVSLRAAFSLGRAALATPG